MEVVAALAGLTRMDHFGPLYKCPIVNTNRELKTRDTFYYFNTLFYLIILSTEFLWKLRYYDLTEISNSTFFLDSDHQQHFEVSRYISTFLFVKVIISATKC